MSIFSKKDAFLRQNYEYFTLQPRKIMEKFNFMHRKCCHSAYFSAELCCFVSYFALVWLFGPLVKVFLFFTSFFVKNPFNLQIIH